MKANHNCVDWEDVEVKAVSNGSKLLKWKQITTAGAAQGWTKGCFQWLKVTKMKANHNNANGTDRISCAVSNGSKLLKWKQITTVEQSRVFKGCCFQWLKVTKMKANHNRGILVYIRMYAVSNGSKLLKWKQITTIFL